MIRKITKIKDSILNALRDTIIGNVTMTREEIFLAIPYDEDEADEILAILVEGGYIRHWDSGRGRWVYAIEQIGRTKLAEGGFRAEEWKIIKIGFIWPLVIAVAIAIFSMISS